MSQADHERVMGGLSEVITHHDWDRLGEFVHPEAIFEYPQSGERFRGLTQIRAQFENHPGIKPGTSQLTELISDDAFAMTQNYTVIRVEGSGQKGTGIIRVRYPDDSLWWAINVYELHDGKMSHSRTYFAPDFEAPEWRAPYREAP